MPSNCTPEGNVAGHAWHSIPSTKRPPFGDYVWWRCERCDWERWDIVNPHNGELMSRRMVPPPGWIKWEGPKQSMSDKRLIMLANAKRNKRKGG